MGNGTKMSNKPSKTSVKNDMRHLRNLGRRLVALSDGTLKQIDLPDHICLSIQLVKKVSSNEAKRRQISFLGKQLRNMGDSDLLQVKKRIASSQPQPRSQPEEVHSWHEKLLLGGTRAVEEFISEYPNTDRQKLKNLLRSIFRTKCQDKKPKAKKKLLDYIILLYG